MPTQGNSPSLEDLMKQLATSNLEFQQIMSFKYERHHSGPLDANRTTSQYCEPFIVGWIQQHTLINNSKSERECECTYAKKWKRTTSTSTATVAEISQCRL
ncbi:hypothetical protein CR513_57013, partial [Mucuna pruriens]